MPRMICQDFIELVTDHLDGVLDPDTERHLVDHLAGCEGCERYLDQLRHTIGMLRGLAAVRQDRRWERPRGSDVHGCETTAAE